MRNRSHQTGAAAYRFPIPLLAPRAKSLLGLILLLAPVTSSQAEPGVSVSATSIDFGEQIVQGPGADSSVQIQNLSSIAILVGIMTNGADPLDFIARSHCPGSLAAGGSCTVDVVFTPSQLGPRSATLVITTDAQPAILMVPLSGTGVTGVNLPRITCPSNRNVTAAAGQTSATVDVGTAMATGDGVSVAAARSDGRPLGDRYPIGTTLITWTATDRSSHHDTCVQTITVGATAQSLPIHCPPNQTVPLDGSGISAHVLPGTATSSAGATIVGVRSDGKALTDPYPAGTTTITWIATDTGGTAGTCTQTITVGSHSVASSAGSTLSYPGSADPEVESVTPDQGPLYQRAIIHGSGFADVQGTSRVLLGGRPVAVLAWSATAIAILVNPLAFDPSPLALNATYPLQVVAPAAGRQSNTVDFSLTDDAPVDSSNPGGKVPSRQPHITSFQRPLFCPGDTVLFLGTGFGPAQGISYLALTVPLADPNGNIVRQTFAIPVLYWSENAISFALSLPSGAIPGTYTATVRLSTGKPASGNFAVGARTPSGDCETAN